MKYTYNYFGQAYGQGTYGAGTYSCTTQQEQQGLCTAAASTTTNNGTGTGTGSGSLVNTGVTIAFIVSLACLIVFVTLVVRIWRRPKAATQIAGSDNSRDQQSRQ
jgi:predicted MFS family arabinose efflux permease